MEITVAKSAGFCFGVNRAIQYVYDNIGKDNIFSYGPIIHNKEVIADLEKRGVKTVDSFEGIEEGTVIIRSHGVGEEVYKEIERRNLSVIDGTCPFVKKIHKIVSKAHNEGRNIIIVGDPVHPEVMGINGWCENTAFIINGDYEGGLEKDKDYTLVVQTTYRKEKFESVLSSFEKDGIKPEVFNTICSATSERQTEAEHLAKKVDKMFVIGDKHSSNTQKLYEICKKNCNNTFYIETIKDLVLNIFDSNDKIGVTAGASTPPAIIKEVVGTMSDIANAVENVEEELSFQELLDQSLVSLHTGDIVKGTVISVSGEEVNVNLGYKSDGIIPRGEYSSDPSAIPSKELQAGDEIEVFVVRVNDGDGNVLLSRKRIEAQKGMEDVQNAFTEGTPVTGKVTEVVKGGIIAVVNGVRVFIPSSQVSNKYIEDLSVYKGEDLTFNIIEFDRTKRRIIGGRKALIEKEINEKKAALFGNIEAGKKVEGTVSRLTDFGAFVDLGGVDGLIHISEMSWGRITNPRDILKEGQTVTAVVLDVDKEKGKISLSLKDVDSNPWNSAAEKYAVGNIVEGKVVRMVPFGAFIELEPGVDGLVHISQIANKHVVKPEDELTAGQVITVKVLEVNVEQKKISLSKKEVDAPAPVEAPAEEAAAETAE